MLYWQPMTSFCSTWAKAKLDDSEDPNSALKLPHTAFANLDTSHQQLTGSAILLLLSPEVVS